MKSFAGSFPAGTHDVIYPEDRIIRIANPVVDSGRYG